MLKHSNRRSRLSFFNIEMMETLRHRESTKDGRRGDCPRGRRAGPEAAVLLSGGYPLREKLGGSEQGKAGDRGGAACMAARKTPGPKAWPIFLPIYRQLDACDLACGAGRSARPTPPKRPNPPSARAPPRWSCRHPVCGRVSRTRGAGGAYNTELAAAKGRSPEGGAPRGPRDGRKKLSEKSS